MPKKMPKKNGGKARPTTTKDKQEAKKQTDKKSPNRSEINLDFFKDRQDFYEGDSSLVLECKREFDILLLQRRALDAAQKETIASDPDKASQQSRTDMSKLHISTILGRESTHLVHACDSTGAVLLDVPIPIDTHKDVTASLLVRVSGKGLYSIAAYIEDPAEQNCLYDALDSITPVIIDPSYGVCGRKHGVTASSTLSSSTSTAASKIAGSDMNALQAVAKLLPLALPKHILSASINKMLDFSNGDGTNGHVDTVKKSDQERVTIDFGTATKSHLELVGDSHEPYGHPARVRFHYIGRYAQSIHHLRRLVDGVRGVILLELSLKKPLLEMEEEEAQSVFAEICAAFSLCVACVEEEMYKEE